MQQVRTNDVTSIMTDQQYRARVRYVIGPDGSPLTVADLPPKDTKRWVIRRKAEVVAAVRGGLLSLEEACERYTLTVDEFLSWQRSIDRHRLARPARNARSRLPRLRRLPVARRDTGLSPTPADCSEAAAMPALRRRRRLSIP
mgnify:CR=1 FL=1